MALTELTSKDLLKTWRERINEILSELKNFAVMNHAASEEIYGLGDENKFGHVKLSDSLTSSYDKSGGIAATPYAISEVYKIANSALHLGEKYDGTLEITSFKGNLIGNSDSSTISQKAVFDEFGNNINQTYATKTELNQFINNPSSNDYAEFFEKGEETEVGDIIALDNGSKEENYVKASKSNNFIVGVHSDTYGHILGGEGSIEESMKTHIPVGLVGRVYTKIVGKITKGDYVVLSDIPGVGRKYNEETDSPIDIIGGAVESSEDDGVKLVKIKLK